MRLNRWLIFSLLLGLGTSLHADWKIEYSDHIIKFTGGAKQRGSFPTKSACEKARDSSSRASGDYANLMRNSSCVGSDSGGSSSGGIGATGYSGKYAMQYMVMQSVLDGFMAGMEREAKEAALREQKAKEEAALRQAQEEQRKQMSREQWEALKAQEAKMRADKDAQQRKEADALLKKMTTSGQGDGLKLQSLSGTNTLGLASMSSSGTIDTSMMKATQRLQCSNYFSTKAAKAKDPEKVQYYNQQMDNVIAGRMIAESCDKYDASNIPEANPPTLVISEKDLLILKQQKMMETIDTNLKGLQTVETQLHDTQVKQETIKAKKEEAQNTIATLQKESAVVEEPQKKQELDNLMADAQALLDEAQKEDEQANATKETLITEKAKLEEELKHLYDKTQNSSTNKGKKQ